MATLKLNEPLRIREPLVEIDRGLPVGTYRVQLIVEGASGRSQPAELLLRIVRGRNPRPSPVRPIGPISPIDPVIPTPFGPT
jgi:hypothetical protein